MTGTTAEKIIILNLLTMCKDATYEDQICMAKYLETKKFKLGDVVLKYGQKKDRLLIIAKGKVKKIIQHVIKCDAL
jgi:hypothetical protein